MARGRVRQKPELQPAVGVEHCRAPAASLIVGAEVEDVVVGEVLIDFVGKLDLLRCHDETRVYRHFQSSATRSGHRRMNRSVRVDQLPFMKRVADEVYRLDASALWVFEFFDEESHLPSSIVRWFKNQRFAPGNPVVAHLAAALAAEITRLPEAQKCTHVCRALGSWECEPSPDAPLDVLAEAVADAIGAKVIRPARRLQARRPMSVQPLLGGRDALERRIRAASSEMVFERGAEQPWRVLFMDDIACSGATAAVWSLALKDALGADDVVVANLASAIPGSPGLRVVDADLEQVRTRARSAGGGSFYRKVWLDGDGICHTRANCRRLHCGRPWWNGVAGRTTRCGRCDPFGALRSRTLLKR